MQEPGDARLQEAGPEGAKESTPEARVKELERLIAEKRSEEVAARNRAARLAAKLKGMPREGGTSFDPHRMKTLWGGIVLGILKGGLQALNDSQRESTEKDLRNAEAEEEQARVERRVLEADLDTQRRKE